MKIHQSLHTDIHLKVEWSRTLPNPAAGVVMTAVAGTIVTSELSGVGDGDTSEVGADTEDDQPLGLLHTLAVSLRISININIDIRTEEFDLISPECSGIHGLAIRDLGCGSVSDEERFAAPFEGHVLAWREMF